MQRLGKNNGSYQGECIDIHQVLSQIEHVAAETGWIRDPLAVSPQNILPAFYRAVPDARHRIYISAGIHGDEPAGPLAVLKLLEQNDWPRDIGVWLIPCLNPAGYVRNCRENEDGVDLNRDYRAFKSAVVRAHAAWLQRQPSFCIALLLHEDWESNGFYLYELTSKRVPSLAEAMIARVKEVCPIDTSAVIEGRPAQGGIICANPDLMKRPDWPEAFYLIHHKCPVTYTLEAPSDFPLPTRIDSLATAVRGAVEFKDW